MPQVMEKNQDNRTNNPPKFRANSLSYSILEEISAGDLFIGFLFSGRSTRRMYRIAAKRAQERYRNKQAVSKLTKSGYVREVIEDGVSSFFITKAGKQALHELYTHTARQIAEPKKWDGMWRIVAYDFTEQERSDRNSLRYILEKAHFKQIQKSVWLSPFDSTLIEKTMAQHQIVGKRTICMTVSKISNEEQYKTHFKLKSI